MTTDATPAERYLEVQRSAEFSALRRKLRTFIFPMTIAFFLWYALYVLLSAYARGFMSVKLVGNINVALLFGLLQFVSTFLIAWYYSRYAARELDPIADRIGNELAGTTISPAREPDDTTTDTEATK
ncbi:DUF485 domain-containing protein [Couchioplanes caeruleus]|uniref:Uncharacterized membrane protein (DUF485 family) n=1 Tax=Couchioplanes caeruleus TaxID=56438 RepID=A0A3N1GLT5_9ACTN|nr:DUF485 domain-containing protein [Couchioplanes caeruleus]ROP31200.1 uncharacterized membrane protein (DUF485 family) [Couchioplanes caeruleus]